MFGKIFCRLIAVLALAWLGLSENALAATGARPMLYVDNSTGDSVSVIDVAAQKLVATIPVGKGPKRVEIVDVPNAPML